MLDSALALLLGAVGGGLVAAVAVVVIWFLDMRREAASKFLSDGLAILAMQEAWILENHHGARLSENRNLPIWEESTKHLPCLRRVEIRAVLDQPEWNQPSSSIYYGFLEGRRTWIVRDAVTDKLSYSYPPAVTIADAERFPALLSSLAVHELRGWIEQLAIANSRRRLSSDAKQILQPLLIRISGEDRIRGFSPPFSQKAQEFLQNYHQQQYRN